MANSDYADVYQRVTAQIVAAIEAGAGTFDMPWHASGGDGAAPINAQSRKPYRGVNVVSLWAAAQAKGYSLGEWATFKQCQGLGAQVRKGERASLAVFWKIDARDEDEDESEDGDGRRILVRGYSVFNAAQVDDYSPSVLPARTQAERIGCAEAFFATIGAEIRHGGSRAFYRPSGDNIQMPPFAAFRDGVAYYAVRAHETIHWTGAPGRLNRDLTGRFGSEAYAAEELVAELGAAFTCAHLGLSNEPRPDHAAYVASWLKILRNDSRAIFTATSKAQAAVDWMLTKQSQVRQAAA